MTKDKVEKLFKLQLNGSYSDYFTTLNEAGKITGKSTLDILTIILESLDELEGNINVLDKTETEEVIESPFDSNVKIPVTSKIHKSK